MQIDRRNDLSLRLLEVFGAVMEYRTTTGAAEYLGVSQPSVSNGIRTLERQLGFTLFERRGRTLRPTEEARILFEESQPIFGMLRSLAGEVRELKHNRSGRLRVASTPPLGHTLLPHCLRELLNGREKLRIRCLVQRKSLVMRAVDEGAVDVGFYLGSDVHEDLMNHPLAEAELVAIVPHGHALADRAMVTPRDLNHHTLIGLGSNIGGLVAGAFEASGVHYDPQIETRYSETACSMVHAGLGVAVVDPYAVSIHPGLAIISRRFAPRTTIPAIGITRAGVTPPRIVELLLQMMACRMAPANARS